MKKIVGVRFKPVGKIYYFNPAGLQINEDDKVIVETARGIEFAEVVLVKEINDGEFEKPLKDIVRIATPKDEEANAENRRKEKDGCYRYRNVP